MSQTPIRHRLDDLRHFATALGASMGLPPSRAAAFATHLLWHDAAGLSRFGIATLPDWLQRLESGEVDPAAEITVGTEHTATAVVDGRDGVGPLILSRAAEVAMEKAREVGVGLARVVGLGAVGPAAAIVADVAIGPMAALALGPGHTRAIALPSANGLPAVFDSALGNGEDHPPSLDALLVPESDWLIQVVSIATLEPLASFRERIGAAFERGPFGASAGGGLLHPVAWEAERRRARELGIGLDAKTLKSLRRWATERGVDLPESLRTP